MVPQSPNDSTAALDVTKNEEGYLDSWRGVFNASLYSARERMADREGLLRKQHPSLALRAQQSAIPTRAEYSRRFAFAKRLPGQFCTCIAQSPESSKLAPHLGQVKAVSIGFGWLVDGVFLVRSVLGTLCWSDSSFIVGGPCFEFVVSFAVPSWAKGLTTSV